MAASDKARFYLEKYVPELREYERKGIFTREEITSIASKRSDFEHTLNARGSKPSDYAKYVTYEMNLDSLRKKRSKRLGVKSTTFSGQRTVFFILDRATKKFPGDLGLWMQYINFCQRENANKKLAKVFTQVLRLKPREWGLWVLAAKHYAENQGDMGTARSYMQRGLRFCNDRVKLWLEYVRLEMAYLGKLAARKKILGLDEKKDRAGFDENDEDEDMLMLPTITSEDIDPDSNKGVEEVDTDVLQRLASTPAFTGGIPIAIFDAAMKQFKNNSKVSEEFFELVATFDEVSATTTILQHILVHVQANAPHSAEALLCEAKMSLFAIDPQTAEFPAALGNALALIKRNLHDLDMKSETRLPEKTVFMLLPYLRAREELDEDVVTVLESSVRRYVRILAQQGSSRSSGKIESPVATLLERLRKEGREDDLALLTECYMARRTAACQANTHCSTIPTPLPGFIFRVISSRSLVLITPWQRNLVLEFAMAPTLVCPKRWPLSQTSPGLKVALYDAMYSQYLPPEVWLRILRFALPHDETFDFLPCMEIASHAEVLRICVHRLMPSNLDDPSSRGPGTVHDFLPNVTNLSLTRRRFMSMTYEIFYGGNNFVIEIANRPLVSRMMMHTHSWFGSWHKVIASQPGALAPFSNRIARCLTSLALIVSVSFDDEGRVETKLAERMTRVADIFRGQEYDVRRLFIDIGNVNLGRSPPHGICHLTDRLEGYQSSLSVVKLKVGSADRPRGRRREDYDEVRETHPSAAMYERAARS